VLVAVYFILFLAAAGRSGVELATKFDQAPVAYSLSAVAAVVYLVATVALVAPGRRLQRFWYRTAVATIAFELVFVLVVGTLTLVDPRLFPRNTVWSYYGIGYLFVPLVLPVLGLVYLRGRGRTPVTEVA
jgi:hypothetical protein